VGTFAALRVSAHSPVGLWGDVSGVFRRHTGRRSQLPIGVLPAPLDAAQSEIAHAIAASLAAY
jgi:hypothetical protein